MKDATGDDVVSQASDKHRKSRFEPVFQVVRFCLNATNVQMSPKKTFQFCVWIPDDFGMLDSLEEANVKVFLDCRVSR